MPYLNPVILQPYLDANLVSQQRHPTHPHLVILNYTTKCQYEQVWDPVTLQCRGLILDTEREQVHAACLRKFFNIQEYTQHGWAIPQEPPVIYTKYDGWYGALSWMKNKPWISTRGSFTSPGAVWATRWFRRYITFMTQAEYDFWRDPEVTHLFEIIAPVTKIVVSYDFEGLVHIATLERQTGRTRPLVTPEGEIKTVDRVPLTDYPTLLVLDTPNSEGFVLWYPQCDLRIKCKFATYVALHRVMTGLSVRGIWEHLASGGNDEDLITLTPDEMYPWLKGHVAKLRNHYAAIEACSKDDVGIVTPSPTRKQQALWLQAHSKYPSVCFQMLDGRDYRATIWKILKPSGSQTFRQESEDV